jgi:hypothetical protein
MRLPFRVPLLLCLLLLSGPAPAPAAAPLPPAAATQTAWAAAPPPALLADGWGWSSVYKGLESCLSSRGGLLRFGVGAMVIALFIIIFNNKWSK